MTGFIKTYLPNKGYGFIKGDDNKDYFFHKSNIKKEDTNKICENALVEFEEKATPKGYNAINISIKNTSNKYKVPDEIITSKGHSFKEWEVICMSDWIIHGSSRNSPEEAKKDIIEKAKSLGVNAILDLEYYKTTGSEPGTGSGTYYFTIHNFKGRLANIGKKSLNGEYTKEELSNINEQIEKVKQNLLDLTKKSQTNNLIKWIFAIILAISSFYIYDNIIASIIILIIAYILPGSTDYDSWLEYNPI